MDIPAALHNFVEVSSRPYQCLNNVNEENELLLFDRVPLNVENGSFYKLANIDYAAASTCVEHISLLVTEPSAYNWREFPVDHYDLKNDIDGSVKSSRKFILTPSCFWFKDVGTIEDHDEDAFYIWSRLICAYYDNFEF